MKRSRKSGPVDLNGAFLENVGKPEKKQTAVEETLLNFKKIISQRDNTTIGQFTQKELETLNLVSDIKTIKDKQNVLLVKKVIAASAAMVGTGLYITIGLIFPWKAVIGASVLTAYELSDYMWGKDFTKSTHAGRETNLLQLRKAVNKVSVKLLYQNATIRNNSITKSDNDIFESIQFNIFQIRSTFVNYLGADYLGDLPSTTSQLLNFKSLVLQCARGDYDLLARMGPNEFLARFYDRAPVLGQMTTLQPDDVEGITYYLFEKGFVFGLKAILNNNVILRHLFEYGNMKSAIDVILYNIVINTMMGYSDILQDVAHLESSPLQIEPPRSSTGDKLTIIKHPRISDRYSDLLGFSRMTYQKYTGYKSALTIPNARETYFKYSTEFAKEAFSVYHKFIGAPGDHSKVSYQLGTLIPSVPVYNFMFFECVLFALINLNILYPPREHDEFVSELISQNNIQIDQHYLMEGFSSVYDVINSDAVDAGLNFFFSVAQITIRSYELISPFFIPEAVPGGIFVNDATAVPVQIEKLQTILTNNDKNAIEARSGTPTPNNPNVLFSMKAFGNNWRGFVQGKVENIKYARDVLPYYQGTKNKKDLEITPIIDGTKNLFIISTVVALLGIGASIFSGYATLKSTPTTSESKK